MSVSASQSSRTNVIAAGLALFSMFFGAGDLIWPLILGGSSGDKNVYAMLGLLITGVSLPLLGLISMMLFQGDYRAFFGRMGKIPAMLIIFIIQAILGPIGSIPRLITLSYATLKPYLPEDISLLLFSFIASAVVLAFTLRRQKIIDILGLVLTPILLLSIGLILVIGFTNHPTPQHIELSERDAFTNGLNVGYNTLDLIASFIFATLVVSHFHEAEPGLDPLEARKRLFKKMFKASLIAATLLSIMYFGLTHIASYYTPFLDPNHLPEERLSAISMYLLGPTGALISCVSVAMACLTTAIPLTTICADYIHEDLLHKKGGIMIPLGLTLGISIAIANMGFMGIANMLSPILHILCPGLIVLSVLNIIHKLYEIRTTKTPVFATFAVSALGYLA